MESDPSTADDSPQVSAPINVETAEAPPWSRASLDDLADLDIDIPIAGSVTADAHDLSNLFSAATKPNEGATAPLGTAASRVFTMLASITDMLLQSGDPNEPFRPMVVWADGRRSAALSDFRGAPIEVIARMAASTRNPVLRARLADVCWVLDRKQGGTGAMAVGSYVDTVKKLDTGALKFRGAEESDALQTAAFDCLWRALQIGRAIGKGKPETVAARELLAALRKRAATKQSLHALVKLSSLDLENGISDPADVAADLDAVLATTSAGVIAYVAVEAWRLAAGAYHAAKRNDDKFRCQAAAAERLVAEAESKRESALVSAHFLSAAIAALHGVPNTKERRTELRHRLIDVQARISDEMHMISHETDIRLIAEKVQTIIGKADLVGQLFLLASLPKSPDIQQLIEDAKAQLQKGFLSSLFSTSHLDREGKVIHRTDASGAKDGPSQSAIKQQIAQSETIRRQLIAVGQIEPARQTIVAQRYMSDEIFQALLWHSPFVPHHLVATFSRGFARFFQGDFVSALYILTPLLEASLRHVLKGHGHDVTIFDDATQTQQDRTISSLFEQMRSELEEILTRPILNDIERVFLSQPGPQIRHSVAHGLLHDGSPYGDDAVYGCALIFRLCLLPLYPHRQELSSLLD